MGVYTRAKRDGSTSWIIQYFVDGRRKREVVPATTKRQAELALAKRKVEIKEGRFWDLKKQVRIRFRDWAKEYLNIKRLQGLKSITRTELSVKHLLGFFGGFYLDAITTKDIHRYINERKRETRKRKPYKPLRPATVNRELAALKNLFQEAKKLGKLDRNPMLGISLLKEDNVRNRCLSEEEFERLLSVAPEHLYGIILAAYETGMRKAEILGLTWEQVDFKKGFIYLKGEQTKSGESRKIPLSSPLHSYLANLPRHLNTSVIFTYRGKPVKEIRHSWRTALRRAKIETCWFHDLRHSFVTRKCREGVRNTVIMAITGHKTLSVFHRYDAVEDQDLKKAMGLPIEETGATLGATRKMGSLHRGVSS